MHPFIDYVCLKEDSLRYERKYCVSERMPEATECMLKHHGAVFREIYDERSVNNIYLDTEDRHFYHENLNGQGARVKIRIRWYGEAFGEAMQPFLEIKVKKGLLGRKMRYALPGFYLDKKGGGKQVVRKLLKESVLPEGMFAYLKELDMTLLNSYQRKYFLSADKKFRCTLDTNMAFYAIGKGSHSVFLCQRPPFDHVIEMKYAPEYDEQAEKIANQWAFRLMKHSKYVRGIESTQR